jgi:hypothetical protein
MNAASSTISIFAIDYASHFCKRPIHRIRSKCDQKPNIVYYTVIIFLNQHFEQHKILSEILWLQFRDRLKGVATPTQRAQPEKWFIYK